MSNFIIVAKFYRNGDLTNTEWSGPYRTDRSAQQHLDLVRNRLSKGGHRMMSSHRTSFVMDTPASAGCWVEVMMQETTPIDQMITGIGDHLTA